MLAQRVRVLRVLGQFGPPVFIFYWPDRPLVSTVESFTIVFDSFHQLSPPCLDATIKHNL